MEGTITGVYKMALSKIEICRKIVSDRQFKKVKGKHGTVVLDMFTASCLVTIFDNFKNEESRQNFQNASWEALGNYIYKKLGK